MTEAVGQYHPKYPPEDDCQILRQELYSLQFLRSRSYITKSGVSMMGISDATESIVFNNKHRPIKAILSSL